MHEEYRIHCAIVDHLRGVRMVGRELIQGTKPFPELFITHLNQGRSKDEGWFLKRMGVYPGVADLLCLWRGGIGFIEVKTKTGTLSSAQKKFKGICHWLGIRYEVARTVKEAHDIVKRWGLKSVHEVIREPDLRTDEQKYADDEKMYGAKKYLNVSDFQEGRINPAWLAENS